MRKLYNHFLLLGKGFARVSVALLMVAAVLLAIQVIYFCVDLFGIDVNLPPLIIWVPFFFAFCCVAFVFLLLLLIKVSKMISKKKPAPPEE